MKRNASFVRLTQWEHWPTPFFYVPLIPFFFLRSLRAGHPFFYTITNPGLLYAGNGTESKFKTLNLLSEELTPRSLLLPKGRNYQLDKLLKEHQLEFPLIVKPDIGFRGYLVKKADNINFLENYLREVDEDVIVQEFIPYEKELGIFYHRIPGQKKGKVSSVTIKKFLRVKGDGRKTLKQVIQGDQRAFLYTDLFEGLHRDQMNSILPKNKEITLSIIGNHSKGTQFLNGNYLINNDLEKFMDKICLSMKGWYYGRLDIKYKNLENLLQGKDFKILEVNGIISEPTHIYDATHRDASYINALKSINRHWNIMASIAQKQRSDHKIHYPRILPYIKNMLWLKSHAKKLKKLNTRDF